MLTVNCQDSQLMSVQFCSSEPSGQSFSLSHFHREGIQNDFDPQSNSSAAKSEKTDRVV